MVTAEKKLTNIWITFMENDFIFVDSNRTLYSSGRKSTFNDLDRDNRCDIITTTFANLYEKLKNNELELEKSIEGYFRSSILNLMVDRHKTNNTRKNKKYIKKEPVMTENDALKSVVNIELEDDEDKKYWQLIDDIVKEYENQKSRLNEDKLPIIECYFQKNMKIEDIAKQYNLKYDNVQKIIYRFKKNIQKNIKDT